MAKRLRFPDHSSKVSTPDYGRSNMEALLEYLFALPDSAIIDASFDGLVDSRSTDADQKDLIQRAFHLGSVFLEAGKRSVRKRSSVHNAFVWPLSPDLTIKVFSMLDTPSVCSAATTCLFFQKCAMDPLCYANIDLATLVPKVNDDVVSTMIQRAGTALQSIKLGVLLPYSIEDYGDAQGSLRAGKQSKQGEELPILTSSCLSSLTANGGAPGSHLRRLHLYYFERMDNIALSASLSFCPSLIDLEIVGLDIDVNFTLESVSGFCRLIERFVYETEADSGDALRTSACKEFVLNCPKITTLALKGCKLNDLNARILVKGFHELKYVDFTDSYSFTGAFLKNLGTKGGGNSVEVMILRDCRDLDKVEVKKFMKALLAGKFSLLRHLDISNSVGLAYNGDYLDRHYGVRRGVSSLLPFLCEIFSYNLLKLRPNFCLVAEFPNKRENTMDPIEIIRMMFRPISEHNR